MCTVHTLPVCLAARAPPPMQAAPHILVSQKLPESDMCCTHYQPVRHGTPIQQGESELLYKHCQSVTGCLVPRPHVTALIHCAWRGDQTPHLNCFWSATLLKLGLRLKLDFSWEHDPGLVHRWGPNDGPAKQ